MNAFICYVCMLACIQCRYDVAIRPDGARTIGTRGSKEEINDALGAGGGAGGGEEGDTQWRL